jgi:L-rhamnose-H+ transport protein
MTPNPLVGLLFHWLGGLASGSFYVPFRGVRRWSWETYWLVGGTFSWILAPWFFASLNTRNLLTVLAQTPPQTWFYCYLFGLLWGFGGLTFGLTMRYLGMSLGMAVALGYCAAFGTLIPPLFRGKFAAQLLDTPNGRVILAGVAICLAGIAIAGWAGKTKEDEMPESLKRQTVREFDFRRGILVATFSGIMSACFAFGLAAGDPIKQLTLAQGTDPIWQGLPTLIIVLLGGFTTNFVWCLMLNLRNRTGYQYFSSQPRPQSPSQAALSTPEGGSDPTPVPLAANYLFSALAGTTWYFQFFFYSMGETQMGRFGFSSWTLHMASIIIFSTLWGVALREWKGASRRALGLLTLGILTLIASTLVVGYGNYLGSLNEAASPRP